MQFQTEKNLIKSNKIGVKSWPEAFQDFGIPQPPQPLQLGKWIRWGKDSEGKKNYKYSAILHEHTLSLEDFVSDRKQTYYIKRNPLKKINFLIPHIDLEDKKKKPKEIEDFSKEFNNFKPCKSHPYLEAKKVTIPKGTQVRIHNKRLIIAFYDLETKVLSGWESINNYADQGKWGKSTKQGSSKKDVCLPIGRNDKEKPLYICEGFSTALSVHSITGAYTFCVFGKYNLENTIIKFLKDFPKQKIIACLDNDTKHPFTTQVRDDRLVFLKPESPGDFNDFQGVEEEREKLKNLTPQITFKKKFPSDRDRDLFTEKVLQLQDLLLENDDNTQELEPKFYDNEKLFPKEDFFLLSGETEAGKTQTCLFQIKKRLENNEKVIIWEHSETNRNRRYNKYFKDCTNKPFYSRNRYEILSELEPGCTLFIDSFDQFMQMKSTIDRYEVAQNVGALNDIAKILKCSIIACHFQTKTSRKETDLKARAGGGMSIINVARYSAIIEVARNNESDTYGNEIGEERTEPQQQSFIYSQKGYRPGETKKCFWIEKSGGIGEHISSRKLKEIMKEKTEADIAVTEGVKEMLDNLLRDPSGKPIERILRRTYYEVFKAEYPTLSQTTATNELNRLHKFYYSKASGYGSSFKFYIYRKDFNK